MKYIAVLGRLSDISFAELQAQFGESVHRISSNLAVFESKNDPDINRFGGVLKFGKLLESSPIDAIEETCKEGKITLGVSDYSKNANPKKAFSEALKIKKILARKGHSVRVVSNDGDAILSTATVHHNQLGEKPRHIELIKFRNEYYLGLGTQNITAYARRDQARPKRDAKVGMLPPKLAQILINLCGPLKANSVILDPFCGTGVVLQEATLMGYLPLGSDLNPHMVDYTKTNLTWLLKGDYSLHFPKVSLASQANRSKIDPEECIKEGDATDFKWDGKIDAVACEIYLGSPMSQPPAEIKLKTEKQICKETLLGFLKNIAPQLKKDTPLTLAIPAWLRPDTSSEKNLIKTPAGLYSCLNVLDEIENLGYNVMKQTGSNNLLYYRNGQIVAREIIVLRKK
ncbi:MAG: hypothetical protein Q4E47_03480 [Candidatus Saccharibacteria bacterium]|nr:hypothetical protein [Candidatus Saccharibacteria bacterium]